MVFHKKCLQAKGIEWKSGEHFLFLAQPLSASLFSTIRDGGYLILNLCKSACRRSHQLKKVAKFVAPSVVYENRSCCCAAHGVQSAFSQINSSPPPLELGAKAQAPNSPAAAHSNK